MDRAPTAVVPGVIVSEIATVARAAIGPKEIEAREPTAIVVRGLIVVTVPIVVRVLIVVTVPIAVRVPIALTVLIVVRSSRHRSTVASRPTATVAVAAGVVVIGIARSLRRETRSRIVRASRIRAN